MKNNIKWSFFEIRELFDVKRGKRIIHNEDYFDVQNNDYKYPVVTTTMKNNGIDGFYNQANFLGNCLVSAGEANGMFTTYQENDFWALDTVRVYTPKGFNLNKEIALFISTELTYNMFRYSYGRKAKQDNMDSLKLHLPIDEDNNPNWKYMEKYIKSLHNKPLTTTNAKNKIKNLNISKWKDFKISDLFKVKYGVNLELNALEQTTHDDKDGVAFVSRTEENNGISAYVIKLDDVEPQKEGTLTVAGGGSVLSTFVQTRPFYSGRDLYLLLEKDPMNIYVKLFIKTVIEQNKYRFAYGRQANKSLPDLIIKLPTKKDGKPNYKYMEDYIKSLPYGDRI